MLNEFLYRGITRFGEAGVFVTCEEPAEDIRRNVTGFGWDYPALEAAGKLAIVDVSPSLNQLITIEANQQYSLKPLLEIIADAVQRLHAHRIAIDNLGTLFARYGSGQSARMADHCRHWSYKPFSFGRLTLPEAA